MSTLPSCTTKNSITDADLTARYKAGDLIKLVIVRFTEPEVGNYLIAHLSDEPRRPIFVATRRDRKHPKVFIEQGRLVGNLARDYDGIPVILRLAVD